MQYIKLYQNSVVFYSLHSLFYGAEIFEYGMVPFDTLAFPFSVGLSRIIEDPLELCPKYFFLVFF